MVKRSASVALRGAAASLRVIVSLWRVPIRSLKASYRRIGLLSLSICWFCLSVPIAALATVNQYFGPNGTLAHLDSKHTSGYALRTDNIIYRPGWQGTAAVAYADTSGDQYDFWYGSFASQNPVEEYSSGVSAKSYCVNDSSFSASFYPTTCQTDY